MNTQDKVLFVIFAVAIAFVIGLKLGKSDAHAEFEAAASLVSDGCRRQLNDTALDFSPWAEPVR